MYKKLARFALLIVILLTGVFAFFASGLKLDYDFENFFPTGDEDLEFFLSYREKFENDNDYLLIGIHNRKGIFEKDFLQDIETVTNKIDSLPLTRQVLSITNLKNPVIGPFGILQPPAVHVNQPELYEKDSIQLYGNEAVIGTLLAKDIPAITILVNHKQMISKNKADTLMSQIDKIMSPYTFDEVHIAGKAKAQKAYISKMETELFIFMSASAILVVLFLTIAYRSIWGVIVPLIVVLLSIVWLGGFMSMTGKMLDIMMVLLPTIMFVVGMSDVVHILTKYIEELRAGKNKIKAIKTTFKEIGLATFLTSLTTSVGFLTLLTASIKPIREFGLYTAIGVFVAFILAFTILPAIMVLLKRPSIVHHKGNKLLWVGTLRKLFLWLLKYKKAVFISYAIILAISIYGITQLKINTFLLEDIREGDPLKESFVFFDEHFGGAKPFEMAILVQDSTKTVYSPEVLEEINKLENFLRTTYGVENITSPVFVAKNINKAMQGGLNEAFKLPDNKRDYAKLQQILKRLERTNLKLPVTADSNTLGRLSGKMSDIGSQLTNVKNQELENFIANNINTNLVQFRLTGTSLLIDKNAEYLVQNMAQGLAIAFCIIAVIAGLLFRSFRMIIITLIPNIIPLLMIAGFMGLFGIYLKHSTSIIFTIAFGIAVDDTIHFVSKLKIELSKGKSLLYAIKNTLLYTGKAIIITSIILAGGFLTLILSSFGSTFYTGLLVSLTLLFAVVADLTLLPLLIIFMLKSGRLEKKKVAS